MTLITSSRSIDVRLKKPGALRQSSARTGARFPAFGQAPSVPDPPNLAPVETRGGITYTAPSS